MSRVLACAVGLTQHRPTATTLLAAAVLALRPVLATLQYRWLGQVSENERARLQRALLNGMGAVARDVDTEVTRAVSRRDIERWVTGQRTPGLDAEAFASRPGTTSGLVRDVLLVERPEGDGVALAISRCDSSASLCRVTTWPAGFDELHQRLARLFRRGSFDDAEELSRIVRGPDVNQSVIVIPVRTDRDVSRGRWGREGSGQRVRNARPSSVALLLLNDRWLRTERLPAIIERHFGPSPESEFYVAVVHREPAD